MLFGLWLSQNVVKVKAVIQGNVQVMPNGTRAAHRWRKVMAEKRTVCQTIARNWKESFSASLASVHREQVRAGQFTCDPSAPRQPRSTGDQTPSSDLMQIQLPHCCNDEREACCRNIAHFCVSLSLWISPSTSPLSISASNHQATCLNLLVMHVNYFSIELEKKPCSRHTPLCWEETSLSHTSCFSPKSDHALSLLHIPKALAF